MKRYFRNNGVALTQLLGAVIGITINANETTSGAAYRRRNDGYGWLYRGINKIFFWQEDHCLNAVIMELIDSHEVVDAYDEMMSVPPPLIRAPVEVIEKSNLSQKTKTKIWNAQAEARAEEATQQDPLSPSFDAQRWFDGLSDSTKARILEVGVTINMSPKNRKEAFRLASNWNGRNAVARENHGMVG